MDTFDCLPYLQYPLLSSERPYPPPSYQENDNASYYSLLDSCAVYCELSEDSQPDCESWLDILIEQRPEIEGSPFYDELQQLSDCNVALAVGSSSVDFILKDRKWARRNLTFNSGCVCLSGRYNLKGQSLILNYEKECESVELEDLEMSGCIIFAYGAKVIDLTGNPLEQGLVNCSKGCTVLVDAQCCDRIKCGGIILAE